MQTKSTENVLFIPKEECITEQIIKRNRFICYVSRAGNKSEAAEYIDAIKKQHPGARHHCWAYIAGNPASTTDICMTDDGEPHGTAGKPMLSALQYSGVGEIVAVVVRYSSGIKLGTGGLVRAYGGAVKETIELMPLDKKVDTTLIKISFPYKFEEALRNFADGKNLTIVNFQYQNDVCFELLIPKDTMAEALKGIENITNGKSTLIQKSNPIAP